MMTIREYARPATLEEAWQLNQKKPNRVLGGMLWLKMEKINVGTAIDLSALGLDTIEETDTEIIIGAMATLLLQLNNSESVLEAAQQVVLGPLALMGFCYLDFSTRLGRPGSKAKRIIIYVLIVLVPYRTNILALVGLMDRMLKTRTRFVPNDKAK